MFSGKIWFRCLLCAGWLLCSFLPARELRAQPHTNSPPTQPAASALHADFEVDPLAYALAGHSLHVGLGYDHWRLDLGNFGLTVPGFLEKNAGFEASASGFGVKLQHFPLEPQAGLFWGVDAALARFAIQHESSQRMLRQSQVTLGVNAGYRLRLPAGFYAAAWLGVSYALGARDLDFGEQTYQVNPLLIFPAVHLGYRLL